MIDPPRPPEPSPRPGPEPIPQPEPGPLPGEPFPTPKPDGPPPDGGCEPVTKRPEGLPCGSTAARSVGATANHGDTQWARLSTRFRAVQVSGAASGRPG